MTGDWTYPEACVDLKCREARADERRRIIAELRDLGGCGAVCAGYLEQAHVDGPREVAP